MGTSKGIGIGVGITVGVIVVAFLIFEMGFTLVDVVEEFEDARLARISANYNDETDRLQIIIILTDSNGEYTKANGYGNFHVKKDGNLVHTDNFTFEKDDFVTWKDNFGNKATGYMTDTRKFFPTGMHEVFVDLNIGEKHWDDLHDGFFSLN